MAKEKKESPNSREKEKTPLWGRIFLRLGHFHWLLPLAGVGSYWATGRIFYILAAMMAAASCFSFCLYGVDKALAVKQDKRISEWTLLAWDLWGGWPGGLLGQHLFHHKTAKVSYQVRFVLCVLANIAVTIYLIWHLGFQPR